MMRSGILLLLSLSASTTVAAQVPRWELAGLVTGQGLRRGVALGQDVGAASSTPIGGEGWLRMPGVQLGLRYAEVSTPPTAGPGVGPALGTLAIGEALLGLGMPALALEAGYTFRRVESQGVGRALSYPRLGLRTIQPLGASGGRLSVAAAYVLSAREANVAAAPEGNGYVTETQLEYRRPTWPLVVMLGYRHEWLRIAPQRGLVQVEETGRMVLGLGVAIGR